MKNGFAIAVRLLIAAFIIGAASAVPARAWVPHTAAVPAVKVTAPPKLDPSLSDPIWKTGTTFENFYDFTNHRPAERATVAYLMYDDKNLYFAAHCVQSGVPIVAAQTVDHAGVASDDHVSLNLETSGSGGRVYQFRVNPRGIHDEFDSENTRYAPDWQSTTVVLPNGDWNLVAVIPLKEIRAQASAVQNWQIDVVRFVAHSNDEYTWAYDDTMNNVGSSQYWPTLTGLHISAGAARLRPHADIYALGAAGADRGIYQNGIGNFEPMRARTYGIDVTVPITTTAAFVGTLNPDFSNVEQDQTTIAPQEFQRQYNEYRPFFAQGANYIANLPGVNINSYDTMFYSPKIGVFDRGLKLEGTQGLSQFGALNAIGDGFDDSALGYAWSKPDQSLTFAAGGVDANHTGLRDDVFGYAAAITNPRNGLFTLVRMQSDRGTAVMDPSQANDGELGAGIQSAHVLAVFDYKDIGPEYNPIDGYLQLNDLRGPQGFYQYTGSGSGRSVIKSYQLGAGADRFVDRSGAAHQSDVFSNANLTFKNLISIGYGQNSSELGFYTNPYPVYTGAFSLPFNSQNISLGFKDGTPSPIDASYSWGPFANSALAPVFLQQGSLSSSQQFGRWGISASYGSAIERATTGSSAPALDSQWLRTVALTRSFGKNASLAIGLRSINGDGGYAVPGTNLAISYHQRFANRDELYIDYGTPAAAATLNRAIVKFVFHAGGSSG